MKILYRLCLGLVVRLICYMATSFIDLCRSQKSFEPAVIELYAKGQLLRKTAYTFVTKVSAKVTTACDGFVSLLRSLVGTGTALAA